MCHGFADREGLVGSWILSDISYALVLSSTCREATIADSLYSLCIESAD